MRTALGAGLCFWPKRNHRVVCIDEMRFDASRGIQPVTIPKEGVNRDPIAE